MDMQKWIEDNEHMETMSGERYVAVKDLQELLKTHAVVPITPNALMKEIGYRAFKDLANPSDAFGINAVHESMESEIIYKAMLQASEKEKQNGII